MVQYQLALEIFENFCKLFIKNITNHKLSISLLLYLF